VDARRGHKFPPRPSEMREPPVATSLSPQLLPKSCAISGVPHGGLFTITTTIAVISDVRESKPLLVARDTPIPTRVQLVIRYTSGDCGPTLATNFWCTPPYIAPATSWKRSHGEFCHIPFPALSYAGLDQRHWGNEATRLSIPGLGIIASPSTLSWLLREMEERSLRFKAARD
jgi:hypothetical protein